MDRTGRAWVTGTTASGDFPTTRGAVGPSLAGFADAFVTRLSPDGRQLDYSTFLGGVSLDTSNAVAVDGQGRAHVTGFTYSPNFPVTEGAFDTSFDGGEAFVAQLGPDGTTLGYATFLGGEPESPGISDDENGRAIAVAPGGRATVAGFTRSADFPTTPGAFDRTLGGGGDAFVTQLSRDGSALAYSTFLGGSSGDDAAGLAVDRRGRAHVTGFTDSADFPTTAGALDRSVDEFYGDAFVAALSRDGSRVLHGTYLGGGGGEFGLDVAVGRGGEIYASGYTNSIDFPTTPGGAPSPRGGNDAFLVRLDPRLSRLASSTVVGGSRDDLGSGLALGRPRVAYVAGQTWSPDFPTTPGALRPALAGDADGFVTTVG